MMTAIDIRIDDAELISKLTAVASLQKRPVEVAALDLLTTGVAQQIRIERLAVADRISAMTPKEVIQTGSTTLIREDRDSEDR